MSSLTTTITQNLKKIYINGATGRLGSLIYKNSVSYLPKNSVLIDVSSPLGLKQLLTSEHTPMIPLVIGTTGDLPMKEIEEFAKQVPVTICPNFSKGVPLLGKICELIRNDSDWDIEITEAHHPAKKDMPSGTAKKLCDVLGLEYKKAHCLRMNDVIGEHTVHLSCKGERIEIKHTATNREIFALGALRVADWTVEQKKGQIYML
jgi:4-hydroxy-tetrahydrodipicolinate reductase